nr:hypothetical protein [Tanacetum cinerariifolium]
MIVSLMKKEVLDVKKEEVTETVFDNRLSDEENSLANDRSKAVSAVNENGVTVVKASAGYDSQFNEKEVLDVNEEEVTETVFDNSLSDKENSLANDRFKKDDFIYKFKISKTITSLSKDVKDAPETSTTFVEKPKEVQTNAPLIQEWDIDSDNDSVIRPKHILVKINFVKAVYTRSGRIPVSAAKLKATASTSAAKAVNTARPKQSVNFSTQEVLFINHTLPSEGLLGHPQQALKNKRIVNSGCFRHMTRNKAYLDDYQEINDGGFVAFGLSRGKITSKVTDDFSRFSWVFFLATKDETSKAEVVNTACYVLNKALVTKNHNKTLYELLNGRSPRLDFMRPFGCPVTILNTLDPLGKFEGKVDEGFLVGYSGTSKAFRVFNTKCEENLHGIKLIKMQVYKILMEMQSSDNKAEDDKPKDAIGSKTVVELVNKEDQAYIDELERLMSQEKEASDAADTLSKDFEQGCMDQRGAAKAGSTKSFNTVKDTTELRSTGIFTSAYDDDLNIFTSPVLSVGAEADFNNLESFTVMEPKKVAQALDDESWFEAMQDELLQFSLHKMDVKSAFLYDTIEDEVYVDDIIFGSTKNSLCDEFEALMHKRFQMSYMGELTFFLGLQVKQSEKGIFISQDKYVAEILKKFDFSSVRTASTPIETQKPLVKDEEAADVDVYLYRSMIGSLMYLKASRPDIIFAVCACSRFQVTPKLSYLHVVKWIFRRLISWQCKKETIVATSTTEADSGLVQIPSSSTPYVPPTRNDWDFLFQLMFDELLNPPPSVDPLAPEVIAPIADVIPPVQAESTGSPSSTTVNQDAPSPSKSQTTPETQSSVIPQDVEEDIHDIEVTHMGNDPLFGVPFPEVTSA